MAALNDEQVMLRDMAREWADNESPVTAYRKLRNEARAEGYDPAAWGAQSEMGWAGIVVPEEFGGSAFGWLSLGLVLEQLGRNLAASPLAATASAAAAIALSDNAEAKAAWLPKIATGEVVANTDPNAEQRLATGDAVNVAARLEQAAPANEVLINEVTYDLVHAHVDVEPVEPLELKGKTERVPAYRLIGVRDAARAERSPASRAQLVGRDRELDVGADHPVGEDPQAEPVERAERAHPFDSGSPFRTCSSSGWVVTLSKRAAMRPSAPITNTHGSLRLSPWYSHALAASLSCCFWKSFQISTWMKSIRSP